jgi:hypothetical protein
MPRLEPEVVLPVETGVEDEMTVASVVGVVVGTATGGVLVVVGIMTTGVEVVGVGAAEELSWMKTAPREDEEVVAGAAIGVGEVVGAMVGAAEVDAGTRTGVPSIVTVAMASGAPVAKDPSASSVTMTCSVTITLSVTTYRSLFRTSYRPAKTSLTSKEETKMARLEKVDERIFVKVQVGLRSSLGGVSWMMISFQGV